MPDRTRKPKRPRDLNQLAAAIANIATEGEIQTAIDEGKNPAAVALGRLGGKKGGRARADKLPYGPGWVKRGLPVEACPGC